LEAEAIVVQRARGGRFGVGGVLREDEARLLGLRLAPVPSDWVAVDSGSFTSCVRIDTFGVKKLGDHDGISAVVEQTRPDTAGPGVRVRWGGEGS
jgi:hypothetical protein